MLEELASTLGRKVAELTGAGAKTVRESKELRENVGQFTFEDIVRELEKPGRDPREGFVAFQYRDDIHELKDLKPAMVCPGIVTNVTNFGAFVDIGVHQDGLVHLSQLADRYVKDPHEVVKPGDRVNVRVLEVNLDKSQISLSMKGMDESKKAPAPRQARARPQARPQAQAQPQAQTSNKERGKPAVVIPNGPGGKPARALGGKPHGRIKPEAAPDRSAPAKALHRARNRVGLSSRTIRSRCSPTSARWQRVAS